MTRSTTPSQRQLRVGELVRHELADIFTRDELGDPDIEKLGVTVTEVAASPDLRLATAYVRAFLGPDDGRLAELLNARARRLRRLLAPRLKLKYLPEIRFRADTAGENAARIDALLRDPAVARDLHRRDGEER